MMKRWFRKRRQRGNAILELGICFPAFALLTLGAMDFSWGVYGYNFCADASQVAARHAATHGSQCASQATCTPDTVSTIMSLVQSEAVGLTASNVNLNVCWSTSCFTATGGTTATGSPASGTNAPGNTVKVTVSYQIQPLTGLGISHAFTVSNTAQYVINN